MDARVSKYGQSEAHQRAVVKAQRYFTKGTSNLLYVKWRRTAINDFAFFDGVGQYHPKIEKILKARDQQPIVVNKIKAMVNQVSGIEINTRYKVGFRSHSFNPQEELLAQGLTHYGLYVQEDQDFSRQGSLKFRDGLICGLGWSNLYHFRTKIYYEYIHPLNVIYDADDFSPQLKDTRFVLALRWMTMDDLKTIYPKSSKYLDLLDQDDYLSENIGNFTDEYFNRSSAIIPSYNMGSGTHGGKFLVVECQYKEPRKFYKGIDINGIQQGMDGFYFSTFNEEEALKMAGSEKDIEEEMGTQMMRTVFCGDVILEHGPLAPNLPNMKDFSYIPYVWERRTSDAVPVGWIENMKDLQRELNYRKLKELNTLNSVRATVNQDAFPGMTFEEIKDQLSQADTLLVTNGKPEDAVKIHSNTDISESQIKASERIDYELQQVSGQYNDALGDQSNATSGIAIRQRQTATVKNLSFAFDGSSLVKKREGQKLLDLIQGTVPDNSVINILDENERQQIVLNMVTTLEGKDVILNNVRTLPLSIYVEPMPDYDSSPEEQAQTLEALLANPSAPFILQNPELLKLLRFRNGDRIAQAAQQLQQQMNPPTSQGSSDSSQNTMPSPSS